MNDIKRIFLDTSVVKHSIRNRPQLQASENAGVYEFINVDPTAKVQDEKHKKLREEIDLISKIAECAKRGEVELLWGIDSMTEFLRILDIPFPGFSVLAGAGITKVQGPVKFNYIVPHDRSWKTVQIDLLKSIEHPRYLQLRKACGANQGESVNGNQLLDAFHIWCAEYANSTHFLTTDFKLSRVIGKYKASPPIVSVVLPSQLLQEIARGSTQST
jgi:hypothetical protein